jgi:serine/threonine-protein kinase HipA
MTNRSGKVFVHGTYAGVIEQVEDEYVFTYDNVYLRNQSAAAVSFTLPKQKEQFRSKVLFSFFDGLIPEGWLLDIAEENWKLDPRDRMGLLVTVCRDCIGAVHVEGESIND